MEQTIHGVVVRKPIDTKNEIAKKNADTIIEFFSLYLKDKEKFYSLWVKEEPAVITPMVTNEVAVLKAPVQAGWDAVKGFWDPIFAMTGQFDWIIDEFIAGEDPNVIVTRSHSIINADTDEVFGNIHLQYNGIYVQIFVFEDGKVKSFEEYYDTALLNSQFGQAK